jgi:adenylate cyclase
MVSEEVMHQLDGFLTRELGKFRLKGKIHPIVIHELLCRAEEASKELREACATFAQALDAFRRQSWDEAIEKFRKTMEILGEDGPSLFYIGLCEDYKKSSPEGMWAGVVHMDKK